MDELQAELLAAFAAELAEHLGHIRLALADADAGRPVDLREFGRRLHSLKGAARAVEMPAVEAAAHAAESLLAEVEAAGTGLGANALASFKALADRIEDGARPDDAAPAAEPERVAIAGRHVERLARAVQGLAGQVAEQDLLAAALTGVRDDLVGLAPLLARHDGDASRRLERTTRALEAALRDHARLRHGLETTAAELERRSERILLQPITTLFEGHERMVRELGADAGKQVTLRIGEVTGDADRRVLQGLREPLLHLLRNAVSHGIEPAAVRLRAGKPEAGSIAAEAHVARGTLFITIADDGGGLDYAAIAARARAAGLLRGAEPDRAALRALVFEQGFSTAGRVDAVSGRGVGLSAVAEAVRRLHGHLRIADAPGGGTRIDQSVPLTLARQTLLLVEAGGQIHALPTAAVAAVTRLSPADIDSSGGGAVAVIDGVPLPLARLSDLLGLPHTDDAGMAAVVLEVAGTRRVLLVDGLREVRTALVGDPTALAADLPVVFGTATIDGGVVLVLAPDALLHARGPAPALPARAAKEAGATVLVVDDSITTRTLERSILEAQGYRVLIDVDGLAALERLRSGLHPIELVVADVEMPRMDGFALLSAIRNDPALQSLPVVMMTSRNHPDDIERGLSLGASAYVTKQDFDGGTLIAVVQQLL